MQVYRPTTGTRKMVRQILQRMKKFDPTMETDRQEVWVHKVQDYVKDPLKTKFKMRFGRHDLDLFISSSVDGLSGTATLTYSEKDIAKSVTKKYNDLVNFQNGDSISGMNILMTYNALRYSLETEFYRLM